MVIWRASDIQVFIDDDSNSGSVVTVRIATLAGELTLMGEIEAFDRELVLAGVHIQSEALGRTA
jgi:hypothetical protein